MSGTKSNQDTSTPIYPRRRISKAKHTIKGHSVHRERSDFLSDSGMNDRKDETPLRHNSREDEHERTKDLSDQDNGKNQEVQEGDISSCVTICAMQNDLLSVALKIKILRLSQV